jgi:hypothetical protein
MSSLGINAIGSYASTLEPMAKLSLPSIKII